MGGYNSADDAPPRVRESAGPYQAEPGDTSSQNEPKRAPHGRPPDESPREAIYCDFGFGGHASRLVPTPARRAEDAQNNSITRDTKGLSRIGG